MLHPVFDLIKVYMAAKALQLNFGLWAMSFS